MHDFENIFVAPARGKFATPIIGVKKSDLDKTLKTLVASDASWARKNGFSAAKGETLFLPGTPDKKKSEPPVVLFGLGECPTDPFLTGTLAKRLPAGRYRFAVEQEGNTPQGLENMELASLGFLLGAYSFDRYKQPAKKPGTKSLSGQVAVLECPATVNRHAILRTANAVRLTRDLINTPANDMGPQELEDAARALAKREKAKIKVIKGAALAKGFAMIEAVGRASSRPPRLIDMTWGKATDKKLTLVGKGVVFDTGGLDLKPSSNMILMKKDMGGAANVLGLAQMIMQAGLPVRLRVLIPAVENAVSGDAYRPSDVLRSRKGLSVEIGNTDAEGRLVLADALSFADEEKPDLLIDIATLTGAARVAVGAELSPFFVDDDEIAAQIANHAQEQHDPVWRLPFWRGYEKNLASKVADTNSVSSGGFGGAITAALFLNKFVENANHHIHFDIYGWTAAAKPGFPVGGEAMGIRALFGFLSARYRRDR